MMTSEREWACYPSITGLVIHQLARREGIDAVHVSRWECDGQGLSPLTIERVTANGTTFNGYNGHLSNFDLDEQ
jgi:hypothetical protein